MNQFMHVGRLLLNNVVGCGFRHSAAQRFQDFEARHELVIVPYTEGKITRQQYLHRALFHQERSFTQDQIKAFMLSQTTPYPGMIELETVVNIFISSSYVELREPDPNIFRMALDVAQVAAKGVIYIEDFQLSVEVATDLRIQGLWHNRDASTIKILSSIPLTIEP